MAQGTYYLCITGHHIVYLGPRSNVAQIVLEMVTECIEHNEHKTSVFFLIFF
jgi:hypothetical protein